MIRFVSLFSLLLSPTHNTAYSICRYHGIWVSEPQYSAQFSTGVANFHYSVVDLAITKLLLLCTVFVFMYTNSLSVQIQCLLEQQQEQW